MKVKKDLLYAFLEEVKILIKKENSFIVIPREKYIAYKMKKGLTDKEVKEIIYNLRQEDLLEGPIIDRNRQGMLWIFIIKVRKEEIYIKLKIEEVEGIKLLKCLSFHENEYQK